jgi:hypothetical protein
MCQGSSKSCTSSLTFWTHKGLKTSFSHLPSIGQATTTTLVAATTAAPAVAATSTPAVDGGEKGFAKQNMAGHFLDTSICFVAFWYDNTPKPCWQPGWLKHPLVMSFLMALCWSCPLLGGAVALLHL